MNVFIDLEFNRETKAINSIGAVYGKTHFKYDLDKANKTPIQLFSNLYNFLPIKTECLFFFFGKEDVKILKSNRQKYEFSDVINEMLDNIILNSVNLKEYINPINLSLAETVNQLGLSVCKPLHDPLSDAINLQTLYDALKNKKIVSKLTKVASLDSNISKDILSSKFQKNLTNLLSLKPLYKKDIDSIQTKIILVNKMNGHEYILNDISEDDLEENKFYKIKTPKILLKYDRNSRECVICLLENADSKDLTVNNPVDLIINNVGMNQDFCERFIKKLQDDGFLVRLSPTMYQISEKIHFLDSGNSRRILLDKDFRNKISIIC